MRDMLEFTGAMFISLLVLAPPIPWPIYLRRLCRRRKLPIVLELGIDKSMRRLGVW